MILQACLNGARSHNHHPKLPVTARQIAEDAVACIAAGANEIHVHPRGSDGRESLHAIDETVAELRKSCPGTLIGVSTGAWIENDADHTIAAIESWTEPPDYASVNLGEDDAPRVMETLLKCDVGIEAGLATAADAERLATLDTRHKVLRILIEIEEQDLPDGFAAADAIEDVLARNEIHKPVLLHGFDATAWPFVERAFASRQSTRVGLEDMRELANGTVARDNAEIVRDAMAIRRRCVASEL
jgi:uncharacterized protein (DUF849 family)